MSQTSEPYASRREQLMDELPDGMILVRGAGTAETGGVNPSFFYLTGLREPAGVLMLTPGGARIVTGRSGHPGPDYMRGRIVRQVLFLPARNALAARWGEDATATVESVSAADVGVSAVLSVSSLPAALGQALQATSTLHYVRDRMPSLNAIDDADAAFVARLQRQFFHLKMEDATPVVHAMRRLKDADEVRGIERSIAVVAEALQRVMAMVKPGMREHEVESEIIATYRRHGGTHAFEPIVASGANALSLHYRDNSGEIGAGDLLLVDTGVSIDGYCADITRTIPVDGRFTDRQREVYDAVLAAEQAAIADCRPGVFLGDLHARAYEKLAVHGFEEHFIHGIGHHLGLETHDVGDVHAPLAPGAVITVEPGAYIEDESIGIRIEDDVLVTEKGHRVLSDAIPSTAEEIQEQLSR
jgi:Xaa-Pro aminopeptidase